MNNEIDLQGLTASVAPADLMAIVTKYPTLVVSLLIIFIVLCVGYGIFWIFKNYKKSKSDNSKNLSEQ